MANSILTPDMITDEALRVLHQKLNFVTNIITEYDDSFAQDGAKIGNTLRIRQPIQYNTGTGATMATGTGADTTESSVTLTVNTQRHVPMRFTSNEMTMKIDDFSTRHIEPAMSKLAAMIESDALSMINYVPNQVSAGTAVDFSDVMDARAAITRELAPTGDRYALLDVQANADLVNALKGLFHDSSEISKQYKEGIMGRTAGMDFYENTILSSHTAGAEAGLSNYLVNGASQQGSTSDLTTWNLIVDTGTKTVKAGDVMTIANVYAVHPETKVSTGILKQFTATADWSGAGTRAFTPALIYTGPYRNVSALPADNAAITWVGTASTTYKQSLVFQKGFACFGTADLLLPKGVHQAARRNLDGISMRLVSGYDVVKDRFLTRMDVLYGYKILRPQLACKILHT